MFFLIYKCGENAHFFFVRREAPRIFIFVFGWGNIRWFTQCIFIFFLLVLFSGGLEDTLGLTGLFFF